MIRTPRKSDEPKSLKLKQIAELVGGELVGDGGVTITGVAGIKEASEGDITFLSSARYLPFLDQTRASAVITSAEVRSPKVAQILSANPSQAFNKVAAHFIEPPPRRLPGVHPTAVVSGSARLGSGVHVGPHAVLEADVLLGNDSVIEAGAFIGASSVIGKNVHIYPNVTLREGTQVGDRVIIHPGAVIGSDGFGYETTEDTHHKIPQTGTVQIDDDVEIGANVCIDRGRFHKTWIQKGVKIDNLVQIAHNVVIGANTLIISQAGISGSTEVGKNSIIAGQAGLVGHIALGDNVIVGAGAGVTKSFPDGSIILGQPAKPIAEQKKILALLSRLPEFFKDLSELKKKLKG